jgi:Tetrapyrrole (Corrin/Porphyrin) Methylases
MNSTGSFVAVGLGMMLGAHLMRPDAHSLQPYYAEGKRRTDSYREMVEAMLAEVRAGRRVCGVFYGHPGVFALVPHRAVAQARAEGFEAEMQPGVSAEDCLYADLGIDPGTYGCQHYETSQLMFYKRRIDPSAYLILWQIGVAGDRSLARFGTGPAYRRLLLALLAEEGYPSEHEVIVYEAATLPINPPRLERMPLSALVDAELRLQSTLVVPPAQSMQRNEAILAQIDRIENES